MAGQQPPYIVAHIGIVVGQYDTRRSSGAGYKGLADDDGVVAAWGIADAIMHFRSEVPLTSDAPPGESRGTPQLQVAPVAFVGGAGAQLAFRF